MKHVLKAPDSQKRIGQSQLAYLYKSPLWGKMVFE